MNEIKLSENSALEIKENHLNKATRSPIVAHTSGFSIDNNSEKPTPSKRSNNYIQDNTILDDNRSQLIKANDIGKSALSTSNADMSIDTKPYITTTTSTSTIIKETSPHATTIIQPSEDLQHQETNPISSVLNLNKPFDKGDIDQYMTNHSRLTKSIMRNINLKTTNHPSVNNDINDRSSSQIINQMGDMNENDQNVIISQLQQLQSPPPKLDSLNEPRDSPISQLTKPASTNRHRGFLSQLLCCFRPASSNVYNGQGSDSINSNKQINNNNSITNSIYGKSLATDNNKKNSNQYETQILTNLNNGLHHHHPQPVKYTGKALLPARKSNDNRICLVIDLDETLVHSSFKRIDNADFIVPVEIYGQLHDVYVLKRPHVDEFLRRVGQIFECVLFTASLAKYADPVADLLDIHNVFKARLFRESCAFYRGNYVKDLSRLGRDLDRVIIVDNSPASYIFHPDNALPVTSYFDDKNDNQLLNLIPELEKIAAKSGPVVPINTCYNN